MNEIVYTGNQGQPLTDSLRVAEKFEKKHCNVIRTIDNLISANSKMSSLFVSSTYLDEQNKERPMYIMNRDGFTLLAMGFTGKKALQFKMDYIEAFNKMEQTLKQTPPPAQLVSQESQIMKQLVSAMQVMSRQINQMQMEMNKQKRLNDQSVVISKKQSLRKPDMHIRPRQLPYYTIKKIASLLGYNASELNKVLEYAYMQNWNKEKNRWELDPDFEGYGLTYVVVYEPLECDEEPNEYLVWTEKGKQFIEDIIEGAKRSRLTAVDGLPF